MHDKRICFEMQSIMFWASRACCYLLCTCYHMSYHTIIQLNCSIHLVQLKPIKKKSQKVFGFLLRHTACSGPGMRIEEKNEQKILKILHTFIWWWFVWPLEFWTNLSLTVIKETNVLFPFFTVTHKHMWKYCKCLCLNFCIKCTYASVSLLAIALPLCVVCFVPQFVNALHAYDMRMEFWGLFYHLMDVAVVHFSCARMI